MDLICIVGYLYVYTHNAGSDENVINITFPFRVGMKNLMAVIIINNDNDDHNRSDGDGGCDSGSSDNENNDNINAVSQPVIHLAPCTLFLFILCYMKSLFTWTWGT